MCEKCGCTTEPIIIIPPIDLGDAFEHEHEHVHADGTVHTHRHVHDALTGAQHNHQHLRAHLRPATRLTGAPRPRSAPKPPRQGSGR